MVSYGIKCLSLNCLSTFSRIQRSWSTNWTLEILEIPMNSRVTKYLREPYYRKFSNVSIKYTRYIYIYRVYLLTFCDRIITIFNDSLSVEQQWFFPCNDNFFRILEILYDILFFISLNDETLLIISYSFLYFLVELEIPRRFPRLALIQNWFLMVLFVFTHRH